MERNVLLWQFEVQDPVKQMVIDVDQDTDSTEASTYETVSFNEQGTKAVQTIEQPLGFVHNEGVYVWNPQTGILTTEVTEDQRKYGLWTSQFDARGCEVKTQIVLHIDGSAYTQLRTCDAQGRILNIKDYRKHDPRVETTTLSYRSGGLVVITVKQRGGSTAQDYEIRDAQGLLVERGDWENNTPEPLYRYRYRFDLQGNWVQREDFAWQDRIEAWDPSPFRTTHRKLQYQ